jgi:excisionase family DNA binding protein
MTEYVTLTPDEVAKTLGMSTWWVREQARRGRIPHLRLAKGRTRLLPEHVDALVALVTVQGSAADEAPAAAASSDLSALAPTAKSLRAHRRRPHVEGDPQLPDRR